MPRQACRLFAAIALLLAGAAAVHADIPPYGPPRRPPPPPSCNKVPLRSVDAAHVERHGDDATLIAKGTAAAGGWHDAELRFVTFAPGDTLRATVVYQLVACPEASGTQVPARIDAETVLPAPPAQIHRIIIQAATNEQTLDLDAPAPH